MTERDATVEELIELWQDGVLSSTEGEIHKPDDETVEIRYIGTDGTLGITYTLSEDLTYRTDQEERGRFNIYDE